MQGVGIGTQSKNLTNTVFRFVSYERRQSWDRTQKRYNKVQNKLQIAYFNIVLKAECESIKSFKKHKILVLYTVQCTFRQKRWNKGRDEQLSTFFRVTVLYT